MTFGASRKQAPRQGETCKTFIGRNIYWGHGKRGSRRRQREPPVGDGAPTPGREDGGRTWRVSFSLRDSAERALASPWAALEPRLPFQDMGRNGQAPGTPGLGH